MKIMASLPVDADGPVKAGEMGVSVAPKGEVNSDNQRAKTPAERLGLFDEKSRAKSEKCLPKWSISKPAARPCAARSRWRRWC